MLQFFIIFIYRRCVVFASITIIRNRIFILLIYNINVLMKQILIIMFIMVIKEVVNIYA